MEIIQVDKSTCTQCGVCAATCPGSLIDFRSNEYPRPVQGAEIACIRCGHCVAICPKGSLTHRDMPADQFPGVRPDLKISPEQCEQLLRSRRSIRAYKDKAVPQEVITRLIEIARYAPTGHNNQEIEWLVIDSRAALDRMENIGSDWIRWNMQHQGAMPGFDLKIMLERQEQLHDLFLRRAPVLVVTHAEKNNPIALIDSSIALSYLDLAASSQGLGCCWAGFVYFMATTFPPFMKELELPPEHSVYGCTMMGYPEFSYHRLPWRKPPVITWHK